MSRYTQLISTQSALDDYFYGAPIDMGPTCAALTQSAPPEIKTSIYKTLALTGTFVATSYLVYTAYKDGYLFNKDYWYTRILYWFSSDLKTDYRPVIAQTPFKRLEVKTGHSHPDAAAERTAANLWIDAAAANIGYTPFSISCSNRDIRAGNDAQRFVYFTKDLSINNKKDYCKSINAIKLVDVDYYVDMKHLMSRANPILMYTFVPTRINDAIHDGVFHIEDDAAVTTLNGGSSYSHKLWDYESDTITADYWWGSVIYLVEQKMCSKHRRIIFLNPTRIVYGPFAWFLPGHRIQRRKFTYNNINMLRAQYSDNGTISTDLSVGLNGQRLNLNIPEKVFTASLIRCDLSKDPSISDVERIFRANNVEEPDINAALFIQLYKREGKNLHHMVKTITTPSSNDIDKYSYQTLSPLVTEDGKPSGWQLSNPMYPVGFIPKRSYNNDNACIQGRIRNVKNPDKPVPPFYNKCREEFLAHVIPDRLMHTFVPESEAFVESQQKRPTQRALAERCKPFAFCLDFIVKSFQKAEIYGKINFPRNISTVPTDHKMRFSAYTYALAARMKAFEWYAFGLNPKEITERVRDLVQGQQEITSNDFSFFDGTHGTFKHEFDRMLYLRAFAPIYHKEVLDLKDKMRNAPAVTTHGVKYKTGTTVLSGGADTSLGNTLIDALIAYIALRTTGMDSQSAWKNLGLYGGDDNLNKMLPGKVHEKVATKLGYTLKITTIKYQQPVPFLGRIFLDPWSTSASICDVPRRIRSLHLTTVSNIVPRELILRRRAEAYLINDPHTPIITDWCHMVLRNVRADTTQTQFDNFLRVETPWFNDPINGWTEPDQIEYDYAKYLIANELKCHSSEIDKLMIHLNTITSIDQLNYQLHVQPEVKVPAVVGGTILA